MTLIMAALAALLAAGGAPATQVEPAPVSSAPVSWASVSPRPPADRPLFSIGAIADCQYADEPDAPPRLYWTCPGKLAAAVETMNGQDLASVFYLGDFIDKDWASFDRLLPIVARSRHDWHFALGNHDFAVADPLKRRVPAHLGMPHRYYSLRSHGWMFVVTDGNGLSTYAWPRASGRTRASTALHDRLYATQPTWDGGIDARQMHWLDATLARADRRGLRVMILDHFPVWPQSRYTLWNAADVLALVDRHPSVKIWLNGHDHRGGYAIRNGVHYVTMSAMLDTEKTAFARLDFYADHVLLRGAGKQADIAMPIG
ncbi:metallophosphoesterase [Sphingomonas abietis]|uniref:Metallophosphoesterase n=1 Tax=Sphingomonas abietis TaxID=3012344 RepID=A0ABY7NN15_9SPHN|nr:metallophosphoesterase [Sphingomonas abietis]WBO22914.1 metallophosphoesterase [Sphingomonas abietis]